MSHFLMLVLGSNPQLKKHKDSFNRVTFHLSHITTQSVILFSNSALIKVPGWESGFLASDAARAARNINICLVPEFPFCFYGSGGLLKYIGDRIKHRGNCVIVYAEGSCKSAADIDSEYKTPEKFDDFFKLEIFNFLTK